MQEMYDTDSKKSTFARRLLDEFPMSTNDNYHQEAKIPDCKEDQLSAVPPVVLHPCVFSFDDRASTKAPPGGILAMQLTMKILQDGFVTAGDTLKISQPDGLPRLSAPWQYRVTDTMADGAQESKWAPDNQLGSQAVGYIKGQARALTLLTILSVCLEDHLTGQDIKQVPTPPQT